jgi:hypothetical protein
MLTVYLADVLTKIVNGDPNSDIDQLLPWAYQKARPQGSGLRTTPTLVELLPWRPPTDRFNRWRKAGVWDRLMDSIIAAHPRRN